MLLGVSCFQSLDVVRVTGNENQIEFINIKEKLKIRLDGWSQRDKTRLRDYLEKALTVDIYPQKKNADATTRYLLRFIEQRS